MKHSKKIMVLCAILLLSGFVLCGLGVRQFMMETAMRADIMQNFDAESLHPDDDVSEEIHIIDETEEKSKEDTEADTDIKQSESTADAPVVTEIPENTTEGEANGQ